MAVWTLTKARIVQQIETLVRRLTNQDVLTYIEKQTVSDAFNAAIVDVCLDAGISSWRFIHSDKTVSTTANQGYVDLTENVFNVLSDTVRIPSQNTTLEYCDLEFIYTADPERQEIGVPYLYSFDASSDPEQIRMILFPIPDSAYTINYIAEVIPDIDSIASFPAWMHGGLSDKAKSNALRELGLGEASFTFEASYQKRKQQAKSSQGHDGPLHIPRRYTLTDNRIHSRIP